MRDGLGLSDAMLHVCLVVMMHGGFRLLRKVTQLVSLRVERMALLPSLPLLVLFRQVRAQLLPLVQTHCCNARK